MNKVMKAVDIELTKEECEILYKAEQLLDEMCEAVRDMDRPLHDGDGHLLGSCLCRLHDVTARYDVHVRLGVDGY